VIPILLVLLAYVLGATPTSYWIGKAAFGVDLRQKGSGNLGATNTLRVLGLKAALPVAVFDVFKGWLPVWLFPQLHGSAPWAWTLAYAGAAIVGHVFSFWVRFRGGKGMATSAGAFLALAPWALLVGGVVWVGVTFTTRIVSLGSIAAAAALPPATYFLPHQGGAPLVGFTTALAAFVIWAHRSNIGRLLRGEENRFGGGSKGAARPPDPEAGATAPLTADEAPPTGEQAAEEGAAE
jgi:glycerol-3-phosphate acyltransferase PlsY